MNRNGTTGAGIPVGDTPPPECGVSRTVRHLRMGNCRQIKIERRTYAACQDAFKKTLKEINENGRSSYDSKTTVSEYAKHWRE